MTREQALQIAAQHQCRMYFKTKIDSQTPCIYYAQFEGIDGPAWIVEAALPPSTFEGSDTLTYVVSVREVRVKYIINASGFPKYEGTDIPFTAEELDELRDMGFDVADQ